MVQAAPRHLANQVGRIRNVAKFVGFLPQFCALCIEWFLCQTCQLAPGFQRLSVFFNSFARQWNFLDPKIALHSFYKTKRYIHCMYPIVLLFKSRVYIQYNLLLKPGKLKKSPNRTITHCNPHLCWDRGKGQVEPWRESTTAAECGRIALHCLKSFWKGGTRNVGEQDQITWVFLKTMGFE